MLVRQPRPTRKRALKSRRSPPALPPGRSSPCPGPSPPPCRPRPCPPTLEAWLKAVHTHAIHSLDASIWWFSIFRGSCGHHHDPVRTFPPKGAPLPHLPLPAPSLLPAWAPRPVCRLPCPHVSHRRNHTIGDLASCSPHSTVSARAPPGAAVSTSCLSVAEEHSSTPLTHLPIYGHRSLPLWFPEGCCSKHLCAFTSLG